MASVNSPIRSLLKPLFFKLIGKNGYLLMQYYAKKKDIKQKLLEEPEMAILNRFVSPNSNTIDIGANFAYYTHRLSNLCPSGQVYAFEPIPFTYQVAKKIVAHYNFKNVSLFPYGVGNENGKMVFEVPLQSFGAYSAGQAHISGRNNELEGKNQHYKFDSHEKINCDIIRIDDFKEINKSIDFVKIDIEGAELFALKGMKNLLLKDQPIVLIEINPFFLEGFEIQEKELTDFINDVDYLTYLYNPQLKKLIPYVSGFTENNYILIPKSKTQKYLDLIS
jgi:FkbM family methyltransferase